MTGSSGSGKTTLLRRVVAERYFTLRAGHVDDLGAPQGARAWAELAAAGNAGPLLVVEGQERPHVILEAARDFHRAAVRVVLIDCGHAERRRRLLDERRQPELDHLDMYAWAAYLRGQADALGLEVLDTTGQDLAQSVAALASSIARFADQQGIRLPAGA